MYIFVYVPVICKLLLFKCFMICTFHLYLKHPQHPMKWHDCYCSCLRNSTSPIVHAVPCMVPPHIYGTSQRVPYIHLWIRLGALPLTASANHIQLPRAAAAHCPAPHHPALAHVLCSCSSLQTLLPRVTFLPLTWTLSGGPLSSQGSANSPWPPPVLSVTTERDSFTVPVN